MLALSMYNVIATIYVGHGVGAVGIAGLAITFPIQIMIVAVAFGIGIGASSIISRSMGANDVEHAKKTLGNAFLLALSAGILITFFGYMFMEPMLQLFGATSEILPYAKDYLMMALAGTIFVIFIGAADGIIRAGGHQKTAVNVLIIGSVTNIIICPIFIFWFGWGMTGAGLATAISYVVSSFFVYRYFSGPKNPLKIGRDHIRFDKEISIRTIEIGGATFARQSSTSIAAVVVNHVLGIYGGTMEIAAWGVINKLLTIVQMPVYGLVQGMQPVLAYNYGAKMYARAKKAIMLPIKVSTGYLLVICAIIILFPTQVMQIFTSEAQLITLGAAGLSIVFILMPTAGFQLIVSGMFQSLGKARRALFFSLLRQAIVLIPLVIILPKYFGIPGVWMAFPGADLIAGSVSITALFFEMRYLDSLVKGEKGGKCPKKVKKKS